MATFYFARVEKLQRAIDETNTSISRLASKAQMSRVTFVKPLDNLRVSKVKARSIFDSINEKLDELGKTTCEFDELFYPESDDEAKE